VLWNMSQTAGMPERGSESRSNVHTPSESVKDHIKRCYNQTPSDGVAVESTMAQGVRGEAKERYA
jgi:hypothetical protein